MSEQLAIVGQSCGRTVKLFIQVAVTMMVAFNDDDADIAFPLRLRLVSTLLEYLRNNADKI
jgi:hypothetical protein